MHKKVLYLGFNTNRKNNRLQPLLLQLIDQKYKLLFPKSN